MNRQNPMMRLFACLLALMMAFSVVVPSVAWAVTSQELQAKLDDARAHMEELNAKVIEMGEAVNTTQAQIEDTTASIKETEGKIAEREAELARAQDVLSKRVAASYKAGPVEFLSVVFSAASFDELLNNFYYADKISQSDAAAIQEVKDIRQELLDARSQLESKKTELEKQKALQDQQRADYEKQAAEAKAYVDNLDQQVKEKLEEERRAREAEAERRRQEALAAMQASNTTVNKPVNRPNITINVNNGGGSSLTNAQRQTIVNAALSCLGTPYVLGMTAPGRAIDCSGLTSYAYAQIGVWIPRTALGQGMSFCNKPVSQALPGDVVFAYPKAGVSSITGHVAIYLGNNQIVEAWPGGARVASLSGHYYKFVSAGSPV